MSRELIDPETGDSGERINGQTTFKITQWYYGVIANLNKIAVTLILHQNTASLLLIVLQCSQI